VVETRFDEGHVATTVLDGTVRAAERPGGPSLAALPDWCLELHPDETPLRASLRRARWSDEVTLELELFAYVTRVGTDGAEVAVQAWLETGGGERLALSPTLSEDPEVTRWARERFQGHDRGLVRVPVDVRQVAGSPHTTWRLLLTLRTRGLTRSGGVRHADRTGSFGFLEPRPVEGRVVRLVHRDDALVLRFEQPPQQEPSRDSTAAGADSAEVTGVRAAGGLLVLDGRGFTGPGSTRFTLAGRHPGLVGDVRELGAGAVEIMFPTRIDEWGRGVAAVRSGGYRLVVERDGRTVDVAPARALADRLPLQLRTEDHRIRVRGGRDGLVVELGPPLEDDELGPRAQQVLQDRYAMQQDAPDPGTVYLQAYTAESATDSPLAIHGELRRRRPDLRLVWAVADRSSWVPDGAETVLWRSRAWYDVVARAGLVVTNIEMEPWFRPRPGQTVVQTFHGYPSKSMGIRLWRSKDFTDSRIEQQLARTSAKWTLLLTPSPEMDEHYRREYRYDGEILASGYPRDDSLLAPDAEQVRDRVRRRLGAEQEQVVVLYAPTWRDDLATNFRAARMAEHLDTQAAAEALGPGYLILLRGHRFHARAGEGRGASGARVLDVTDHPEINDLVLACDVAVLDYSSLRFDVAVAGRPMVFLVPDLDAYTTSTRGFLHDFRESAPGPLLSTTGEVVDALRDLDRLRAEHREHYDRFNARFNRLQDGRAAVRVVDRLLG
jgi:CDP-glycerol glycerophosphotransferase (TagB/SpsB family)